MAPIRRSTTPAVVLGAPVLPKAVPAPAASPDGGRRDDAFEHTAKPSMTPLTARVLEASVGAKNVWEVFEVTGNVKPMISTPRQTVKLPQMVAPRWDEEISEQHVEFSIPLRALDVHPLTHDEFLEALEGGSVRLPGPWTGGDPSVATIELHRNRDRTGPSIRLAFDHVDLNRVLGIAPVLEVTLASGQLVFVEVKPETLVLDRRELELRTAREHVQGLLDAGRRPDAPPNWERDVVEPARQKLRELEAAPFVGEALPTLFARSDR